MRVYTTRTIEVRDRDGAIDRYHGGRVFDVDPELAATFIEDGAAVRVNYQDEPIYPQPEPEPEPQPEVLTEVVPDDEQED